MNTDTNHSNDDTHLNPLDYVFLGVVISLVGMIVIDWFRLKIAGIPKGKL